MRKPHKSIPAWKRFLSACGRILLTILRTTLLLLLIIVPIPMVLRPYVPKPAPRNVPAQVKREE